jgi:hypothetical protein
MMASSDPTRFPSRGRRARLRRPLLGLLAALALTAGTSAIPAYADVDVNLSCNDGTNLSVTLDLTSLQALQDSVQAMILYPTELTCSVAQLPGPGAGIAYRITHGLVQDAFADSGNQRHDYAVGGGQAHIVSRCLQPDTLLPQDANFGMSAHVEAGTPAIPADQAAGGVGGHFSMTLPQCLSSLTGMAYTTGSHLGATVDCLVVAGADAFLTAHVDHATNFFASIAEFGPPNGLQGKEIAVAVHDGIPDRIGWSGAGPPLGTSSAGPCNPGSATADATVDRGNVTVHDAG